MAEKTFMIFYAKGCILERARGKTPTNTSKLFSIVYIEIKIID